jgi:SAM-dependent methyltransferase
MDSSLYQKMHELEDRHWWFVGRRRIVKHLLKVMQLPKNTRILDLGCGTGGNLAMLAQFGQVLGAELDAQAAQLARARGVASVVRGRLPDGLPLAPGRFQCVTLLDVLEHIADDQAVLRAVRELLAPDGCLLLTVPAFPFLWGPHDEAHHHQRRYRAQPLRRLLEDSGFQVERLSYYNSWLFPFAAAVRLLRRWSGVGATDAGTELALPPAPLNAVLATLFASERYWLARARLPFGVSLIAQARRL